ncbi:MAG: gamma-glutamyl-gamma-aminobutyrate hydrolase family protein [Verrucomicrobia bacterium]|nr:gamma-glutamyl-gamma-aminobutyrate hydrolase family protein [Verrucomicrobiota bacterium]
MKSAPLILITSSMQKAGAEFGDFSLSLSNRYSLAVTAAGGIPWVMPNIPTPDLAAEAVCRADGVMLTGGDDLQPRLYAQRLRPALRKTVGPPEPERDLFELQVIYETFRRRKPLFAICRGLQILNVALGGTMIVDIPSELPHALNHRRMDLKDQVVHDVAVEPGSLLARVIGNTRLGVNSSHHQAAGQVAGLLKITAQSADGVVEGLEVRPGAVEKMPFLLAVQFHPERLCARHREHRVLFERFVAACGKGAKSV